MQRMMETQGSFSPAQPDDDWVEFPGGSHLFRDFTISHPFPTTRKIMNDESTQGVVRMDDESTPRKQMASESDDSKQELQPELQPVSPESSPNTSSSSEENKEEREAPKSPTEMMYPTVRRRASDNVVTPPRGREEEGRSEKGGVLATSISPAVKADNAPSTDERKFKLQEESDDDPFTGLNESSSVEDQSVDSVDLKESSSSVEEQSVDPIGVKESSSVEEQSVDPVNPIHTMAPTLNSRRRPLAPDRDSSVKWFAAKRSSKVVTTLRVKRQTTETADKDVATPRKDAAAATKVHEEEEPNDDDGKPRETVAVLNANSEEGGVTVRALSASGCNVIAVVRVFTSRNTKALLRQKRVTVKVADTHDRSAVGKAIQGADRAILVTRYWENFENQKEKSQAMTVIDACKDVGVSHLVFSTFEDTKKQREQGKQSQLKTFSGTVTEDGNSKIVQPVFDGMVDAKQKANDLKVMLTHMMTSYLDQEQSKKSLCVICGANGKLIVKPSFKET